MADGSWRIVVVDQWPGEGLEWRLALEVDPRTRRVFLGPRIDGTGGIEIQSGAVARSFFDRTVASELAEATTWLGGDEATVLLDAIAAGFACEMLWTGDLSVSWSEAAWQAGNALVMRVAGLVGAAPWP